MDRWLAAICIVLTVFAVSRLALYGLIAAAGWTARVPRESGISYHALFGPLGQWDVVRVAPNVLRGFEGGPDGLELIAVGNDRPEGGDGEMVQDFWTD